MAPFGGPPIILVPQQTQPIFGIKSPCENDVLCGRGTPVDKHPGNKLFRTMILSNKDMYVTLSKKGKMVMTESIVRAMREKLDPPSRFLRRDPTSQLWFDIGFKKSSEKTAQALRDASGRKSSMKRHTERILFLSTQVQLHKLCEAGTLNHTAQFRKKGGAEKRELSKSHATLIRMTQTPCRRNSRTNSLAQRASAKSRETLQTLKSIVYTDCGVTMCSGSSLKKNCPLASPKRTNGKSTLDFETTNKGKDHVTTGSCSTTESSAFQSTLTSSPAVLVATKTKADSCEVQHRRKGFSVADKLLVSVDSVSLKEMGGPISPLLAEELEDLQKALWP